MKAMQAAKVVAPPKAMKAKKEDQWTDKKKAELQQAKRDNVRLSVEFASIQAAALERANEKEAELQRVQRDNERLAAALEWKDAELQRAKRDKVQRGLGDLDSEIQAVEQMRGMAGRIALNAKACEVGVRLAEKTGGKWKLLRLEVLRMRVLGRLRWLRWRGRCSHAGSCSGWKRLRSKTKENNSSSSSATTNEQSAKCRKGEGQ